MRQFVPLIVKIARTISVSILQIAMVRFSISEAEGFCRCGSRSATATSAKSISRSFRTFSRF